MSKSTSLSWLPTKLNNDAGRSIWRGTNDGNRMGLNPQSFLKICAGRHAWYKRLLEGMIIRSTSIYLPLGGAGMPDMSQLFGGGLKGKLENSSCAAAWMAKQMKKNKKSGSKISKIRNSLLYFLTIALDMKVSRTYYGKKRWEIESLSYNLITKLVVSPATLGISQIKIAITNFSLFFFIIVCFFSVIYIEFHL